MCSVFSVEDDVASAVVTITQYGSTVYIGMALVL